MEIFFFYLNQTCKAIHTVINGNAVTTAIPFINGMQLSVKNACMVEVHFTYCICHVTVFAVELQVFIPSLSASHYPGSVSR